MTREATVRKDGFDVNGAAEFPRQLAGLSDTIIGTDSRSMAEAYHCLQLRTKPIALLVQASRLARFCAGDIQEHVAEARTHRIRQRGQACDHFRMCCRYVMGFTRIGLKVK